MAEGSFADATLRVFRGDKEGGAPADYRVPLVPGMVVLDALHSIQSHQAPDLAVRWNCKAGKCGSCSAEVNGRPKLMCMTRLSDYPAEQPITITPMKAFPLVRDLVTDVSWNYEVNKRIPGFRPRTPDAPDGTWRMFQYEVERPQEFRKCIECFLCQDVCHVLRTHGKHQEFIGHAFLVSAAAYETNPIVGGQIGAYTEMCEQARQTAYDYMVEHARQLGANAIVGVRYDAADVGGNRSASTEVLCYGTAVVLE